MEVESDPKASLDTAVPLKARLERLEAGVRDAAGTARRIEGLLRRMVYGRGGGPRPNGPGANRRTNRPVVGKSNERAKRQIAAQG